MIALKILLSFIIPCYRSEKTIEKVIDEIIITVKQQEGYNYEIICINDSSPDSVYEVLKNLASKNNNIKVINLSKNMGKHSALMAGYSVARGDFIVSVDDDYQCPVNELWKLVYAVKNEGFDLASAKYRIRNRTAFKRLGSNINRYMSYIILNKPLEIYFSNFSVMKKYIMDEIIKYKGPYPYVDGLLFRIINTNKIKQIDMEERERADDKPSGFTLIKSLSLFLNGLTAFSVKPLRLATIIGFLSSTIGFLYALFFIIRKLLNPEMIASGFSSIISILLITSGIIMVLLGIIGEYIGRIYICINASPQYIISETININTENMGE
jgi:undecaprenyl-phosphate 4-deoxy-4-formamido-L-arabinose transferase